MEEFLFKGMFVSMVVLLIPVLIGTLYNLGCSKIYKDAFEEAISQGQSHTAIRIHIALRKLLKAEHQLFNKNNSRRGAVAINGSIEK
ncbi:hypothetical protein [Paenibacillus prosopidis]|uniref:Uncharacterized protein n=1 Tax=Paenibacillus prosopidis TaxID=630520 RepID=A0A368VJT3_9BACL|nr:hypothetical protein [Paenibacillus prosopidis]RCW41672.1 hypothetical protein DFP97_122108 [Paenibacillus prosopidis]